MSGYISPLPTTPEPHFHRRLVILGSTGSIGRSALCVVEDNQDAFTIVGLAGAQNVSLLAEQARKWRPSHLAVLTTEGADALRRLLPTGYAPSIHIGPSGYEEIAALPQADIVLSAQVGAAGLAPTLAAIAAGKRVALANKEALVLAGELIRKQCHRHDVPLLPVDSEHNALFQALSGHQLSDVKLLHLTASGGPFRTLSCEELSAVTPEQALSHPTWSMGAKISIDSATLMNKGLECIEAQQLFGLDPRSIKVIVHPESIVHSLVEYCDGSFLAELGIPDMRIPIAFCLAYPRRLRLGLRSLDLADLRTLHFEEPDQLRFPCLALAQEAMSAGQSHRVVLNAANEVAVDLFLKRRISFLDIPALIANCLETHEKESLESLEAILHCDAVTRGHARAWADARTM